MRTQLELVTLKNLGFFLVVAVKDLPKFMPPKEGMIYIDDTDSIRTIVMDTPEYWEPRGEYKIIFAASNEYVQFVPGIPEELFTHLEHLGEQDKLEYFIEWKPICCNKYTSCNSNCTIEGYTLSTTDKYELEVKYVWSHLNYTKESIKQLFHRFIDKYDIDTTSIDVEQFFEENL